MSSDDQERDESLDVSRGEGKDEIHVDIDENLTCADAGSPKVCKCNDKILYCKDLDIIYI